jgi:phage terminase large subunit-like protein
MIAAPSFAARLAALPKDQLHDVLAGLGPAELESLRWSWEFWRREDQTPPDGPWRVWALIAGRGSGKTWTGAQWVRSEIESGRRRSIAIAGPTNLAVRKVQVEGPSGLLSVCPPDNLPTYEMATGRLRWPNGGEAHILSSETPDRARGYNFDGCWADELCAWEDVQNFWDQISLATRITGPLGGAPRLVITTTPRNISTLKQILADPGTVITRASTFANAANLDPEVLKHLQSRYGNTSLGRQELLGQVVEDVEGALWTRALIDGTRVKAAPEHLTRVVVAIDPAGTSGKASDETGIIVAGRDAEGHGYVIADLSGKYSPDGWARRAIEAYRRHRADRIVAETNFGAAMVENTLRAVAPDVPFKALHASRGKAVRAEPVVALFEQNRAHIVGHLAALEDQLCGWDPNSSKGSPDRLDSCVWAITELLVEDQVRPAYRTYISFMSR